MPLRAIRRALHLISRRHPDFARGKYGRNGKTIRIPLTFGVKSLVEIRAGTKAISEAKMARLGQCEDAIFNLQMVEIMHMTNRGNGPITNPAPTGG